MCLEKDKRTIYSSPAYDKEMENFICMFLALPRASRYFGSVLGIISKEMQK